MEYFRSFFFVSQSVLLIKHSTSVTEIYEMRRIAECFSFSFVLSERGRYSTSITQTNTRSKQKTQRKEKSLTFSFCVCVVSTFPTTVESIYIYICILFLHTHTHTSIGIDFNKFRGAARREWRTTVQAATCSANRHRFSNDLWWTYFFAKLSPLFYRGLLNIFGYILRLLTLMRIMPTPLS